ncbi:MAG: excinuclease subunit [Micromonosporaceae bacterium]
MAVADARAALPSAPGVYRFRDGRGRVLYVGRASNLRRRVDSYWGGLRDRAHLTRMVARIARIEAVACDSAHEAAWLERNVLERAMPRWNRTPGGQEVPVYIRLDTGSRSPGLRTVHSVQSTGDARYFGPYLGGAKVRLAVAALHRVLPLAYAADGLRGAERDMARVRGVAPAGRDALIEAVSAVLDRDPAAASTLRAELVRRRDGAAGALAFELAGRLHEEIEALDWAVGAQRVTLAQPRDFDVCGWAAGVLVRFEVRAGLMCAWTQRECSAAGARPLLASTPAGWAPFAQRNAELAAELLAGRKGRAEVRSPARPTPAQAATSSASTAVS